MGARSGMKTFRSTGCVLPFRTGCDEVRKPWFSASSPGHLLINIISSNQVKYNGQVSCNGITLEEASMKQKR